MNTASNGPLGQPGEYPQGYSPELLYPIPRARDRADLSLSKKLPFDGVDLWNAYELSWLDKNGKPIAAVGEFTVPAYSPNIIESKSLKLYLNSFNQTRFAAIEDVRKVIQADVGRVAEIDVGVNISLTSALSWATLATLPGTCLDSLAIEIAEYDVNPGLLKSAGPSGAPVSETLHTHLFKSNCPVTGQPDWASVMVRYQGPSIDQIALLRYLISFRNSAAFHEHCVERIFVDILARCRPDALTVYARYTRRGGLDINPFRSNFETTAQNLRLPRQ